MTEFKAPLTDIQFLRNEVFHYRKQYENLPGCEEFTPDLERAVFEEAAKFAEKILAPLNQTGDEQGCRWESGNVFTPEGFKEAYQQYVAAGWPGLAHAPEYGGQGLPPSMELVLTEFIGTANWSWSTYPALGHGAMAVLEAYGSKEQKETCLSKLISGEWTATMCLTEAHCGTDLGLLRTRAEENGDGSYRLSGTKIFITSGEHDMADNILHMVLARIPGSPAGTKGISLFLVPKFIVNKDAGAGARNSVHCGSIEKKMGINGSATCVMNFDQATGYLIGSPDKGLRCMFVFMNAARLGAALQGVAHAELGFQKSLAYAKERLQMRSLTRRRDSSKAADPIIVHPDVRRMLLTQKAFAEGGRALIQYQGMLLDIASLSNDESSRKRADKLLAFLTPISKAFLTEVGFESANLGLQCFGGHGYIREWGVEQNVRDSRISMLYEGTTGIQALDLLSRKVLADDGALFGEFTNEILAFCNDNDNNTELKEFICALVEKIECWRSITREIQDRSTVNPDEIGAASVEYLMFSGYLVLAYVWARMALSAQQALRDKTENRGFYQAKLLTARFYFKRLLPRTKALSESMLAGADVLMSMDEDSFALSS